ncbi:DUF4276 family protein [Paraneptunicella aestuarii]|uniref:DUF4276 family protein n=1 Tax=Paraneptunicella aestuarii TaxID=2831148 RepID=UPI001E5D0904|nr:DUF4276 family protein [Paraneptunicella aestuarii]UAA40177.1 DUF4276 family protein [Paraneptunicella aestuarii]
MVRVGISVEGVTEERFVTSVLSPYLAQKEVFITAINMGGDVKLDRIASEVRRLANSFDFVTTLYDFYGFKKVSASETKASLEAKILERVPDGVKSKLIPYVQMYEFEGLLFSSPEAMQSVLQEPGVRGWAESVLQDFDYDPEKINNSRETAPSKRLISNTKYRKTTHGPDIAKQTSIDVIRHKCAGFNEWVGKLEVLS